MVNFDGIPLTVAVIHKLQCQFGSHYYKEHSSNFINLISGYWVPKIGCPSYIHIHKLHLYPIFNVSHNVVTSLGSRKLKEMRAKRLVEFKDTMELQTK